jgi:7,8-dihydro-6-hydroxymethylpterin dimethyltransferase
MSEYLTTTQSVCRICRRLISAQILVESGGVWLQKECPEHGRQKARIYGDAPAYLNLGHFHRRGSMPLAFATKTLGCPDSCGTCPEHEQHVCLPILEITDHCNWDCPICLVTNPGHHHWTREQVARVLDGLIQSEGQIDVLNLSGGEPTLNPYFREIIEECIGRKEILRVSVSTNGSVLVRNRDLLQFLADRRVIVSLQFDGLSDDIYQNLRGRPLLEEKRRLIDWCGELDSPMSLTATVARGVNDDRLTDIAGLLFHHDHILSAMFQPAAYAGTAAAMPRPAAAVTIPDVITALNGAGPGIVSVEDFSPLPCSHPACFSLAFYLKVEDNRYVPIKQMVNAERYMDLIRNRAIFGTDAESFQAVTDAVYELWSGPAGLSPDSQKTLGTIRRLLASATANGGYSPRQALTVAERAVKSIFIHQFMDPETFDLSRARKCCQVYPQLDGRLTPVCVHNCLKRNSS